MNSAEYEKTILERLIAKYNKRIAEGTDTKRRVILKPTEIYRKYDEYNADPSEKENLNAAVKKLLHTDYISVSRLKYSSDIEKIFLNSSMTDSIYKYLNSEFGIALQSDIDNGIRLILETYDDGGRLTSYYHALVEDQLGNPSFSQNPERIQRNFQMLQFLDNNHDKLYIREASMLVYGDSKYFEENNYQEICKIARLALNNSDSSEAHQGAGREEPDSSEVRQEAGQDKSASEYACQGIGQDVSASEYARQGIGQDVSASEYARQGIGQDVSASEYARQGIGQDVSASEYACQGIGQDKSASEYARQGIGQDVSASEYACQGIGQDKSASEYACQEWEEDILKAYNIMPAEQDIFIKGAWIIMFHDCSLDIATLSGGIALSSIDLSRIINISINSKRMITVENKTSYQRINSETDSYMYLGGFANRHQISFLQKAIADNPDIEYEHFGDIDIGGFLIHRSLCEATRHKFALFKMGIAQLSEPRYAHCLHPLTANDIVRMQSIFEDDEYRQVLSYMKKNNVKLEQEIISMDYLAP